MCGIVGYTGRRRAAPLLLNGLLRLEYRGYDSAGIALQAGRAIRLFRCKGRVDGLSFARGEEGNAGIGHTRWATHGAPLVRNAHPHRFRRFAIVHNGIIENAAALRAECTARGERFSSETDSEVIAHLLDHYYEGDALLAMQRTVRRLKGSYAIAALCTKEAGRIVCARRESPLLIGVGAGEAFVASDLAAIGGERMRVYCMEDGEFVCLREGDVQFYDSGLNAVKKRTIGQGEREGAPSRGGFAHFMQKELAEIPRVLSENVVDFASERALNKLYRVLCQTKYIQIVACGTAYHSGLCAKYAIESLAHLPVGVEIASEYRDSAPLVPRGTLCIAVSQSGETADTIAAARVAREHGAKLAVLTNVPHSSLTRVADFVLVTRAGEEVAVAATKSFSAQLAVLYSIAAALSAQREEALSALHALSSLAGETLRASARVQDWTARFLAAKSSYFIGRGADRFACLEGSLKLKEIAYLPSEGYAAGELKHGTLALIGEGTPVVALMTQRRLFGKMMNAVHEVRARGAAVFLVTPFEEAACACREGFADCLLLPRCKEEFSPALSSIPLQTLAYHTAVACGNDPDKPRNLAKSVTVE